MVINNNISALDTLNQLNSNTKAAQNSLTKLSSGLRINSPGDDAAGLAISQKMQAQINGLSQSSSNAQNGISLIQTAEGALSQTQSILQRINTLSTEAANDTNTTSDRSDMQDEVNQLTQEIDQIGNTTQFNTKNLLNGGAGVTIGQTVGSGLQLVSGGADVAAGTNVALTNVTAAKASTITFNASANNKDLETGTSGANITLNGTTINIGANATGSAIAAAINAQTSATGVTASYTQSTAGTKGSLVLNSSEVGSAGEIKMTGVSVSTGGGAADSITDTAAGQLTATNTAGTTILAGGTSLASGATTDVLGADASATTNVGTVSGSGNVLTFGGVGSGVQGLQLNVANASASSSFDVTANNGLNLQIGALAGQTMYISINDMRSSALGVNNLDLTTQAGASAAITSSQTAIDSVSTQLADLGAYQNRLNNTINNLSTEGQNLTSASSQITDVDMASEMTNYTKSNILVQSSEAMLAQANQLPQGVLSLLK
jgi:flagellin